MAAGGWVDGDRRGGGETKEAEGRGRKKKKNKEEEDSFVARDEHEAFVRSPEFWRGAVGRSRLGLPFYRSDRG